MALNFDRSLEVTYRAVDDVIPGVRRVVAENPGPYTFKGTATFIIGRGDVAIVDPGPAEGAHIDAILAALPGERITHQLITHTHPDHSPGARLIKERTGAPTFGFGPHPVDVTDENAGGLREADEIDADKSAEQTGADDKSSEEKSDVDFVPDTFVADDDVIRGEGWSVQAVHTPGHLANHVCWSLDGRTLFSGDHVMGWSTSVISPPGGNLDDYLDSLSRLLTRTETLFIPTHGSPIADPHEFVRGLIDHRNERTAQIRGQLRLGPRTVRELVTALYVGLDTRLVKAAGRSVSAHLESLQRSGAVLREEAQVSATTVTTRWRESP
jgi:glyoxylase-like metal-dependent hydrolase (beta-lactamase superfamily II)